MADNKNSKDIKSVNVEERSVRPRRSRRPAAETRQEILNVAEALFRERGYQQVAMADIAATLDMSPANVFKHFHAKTALVDAIASAHIEKMMERVATLELPFAPQAKLLRVAEELLNCLLADIAENGHLFEMVIMTADLDLQAGDLYRAKISGILEGIILEGVAAGEFFVRDPRHTAAVVTTALEGVLNPLSIAAKRPDVLYSKCRDVIELVNIALQNPLAK